MKTRHILAALAATFLFTGCFQEFHEFQSPETPVGYVIPVLEWANPDDAGTTIQNLILVVDGPGVSFTKYYADAREIAGDVLPLPLGDYGILAIANATEANGYDLNGLPATKADAGNLSIGVGIPGDMPRNQAFAGAYRLTVREKQVQRISLRLQDILPSLTVSMSHIPSGATVYLYLVNMARQVILSPSEERPAQPASSAFDSYTAGRMTADKSGFTSYVLPTSRGMEKCLITLEVQLAGTTNRFLVEAPRMECGMNYTVDLDFNDLSPDMHLDAFSINEWKEGWTYSGRVY